MLRRRGILAVSVVLPALAAGGGFEAATATNQLGIDLFPPARAELRPTGNLVISPYSIDSALALAYFGADGATRTEMAGALHFPQDDSPLQASFAALRASLDEIARESAAQTAEIRRHGGDRQTIEWYQANRLFGQNGYAFRSSFLDLMQDGYDAPFESLDFKTKPNAAQETINAWVEEQTRRKIRDLIPRGALDARTRLVLVNALYLKAPWSSPFINSATTPRPFHVTGTVAPKVPTMTQRKTFGYVKEPGFSVVALDYAGAGLQFLILLPDEGSSCDAVMAQLTPERFREWAKLARRPHSAPIELYLPKFAVKGATLPLGTALRELGVKHAFDEPRGSADFTRMAPPQPDGYLKLAEVFHKTFVVVDEEGTEAAAATAVLTMTTLGIEELPPPIIVRVDRPFLFVIQHRASGACLFLGRITDPR